MICALLWAQVAACAATQTTATAPAAPAAPTSTETPTGDLLLIDGEPVRRVLIADPAQGPVYDLTDEWLFVRIGGRWVRTATRNDGRHIVVDPTLPESLFRGDHPPCHRVGQVADIAFEVSDDGGMTWSIRAGGVNVRPLLVSTDLPDTIYGSDCRLALTSDAGVTWTRLDLMPGFAVVDLALDGTRLYVLGVAHDDQAQVRTVDLSDPLAPVPGGVVLGAVGLRSIDAAQGRVVAGGVFGVYVSDDGGATWAISRTGLENVTRADAQAQRFATAVTPWGEIGVLTVEVDPRDSHRIFAGASSGLYVSQDDGATWVRYDEAPTDEPITEIQFALGGADLYITTSSGVIVAPSP